ncbi:DEAD/DEAH box helicase [Solitalea lacus]|uniref:DEAD/DEAH box helicase n=1 Tax=Solitalea lacus TaxID=2911172 RepID=UPI001EDC3D0A|nr:DEAD/DEAH box helicase [Solitalea lacus]UKJ06793.1 DEAD/DEAH box helicase [Solitalea lacus]
MSLNLFHKVVSSWFEKSFQTPTDVQVQAWNAIKSGENTLIAAPTGSGKTLAAFLSAIDELVKQGIEGRIEAGTQVVYISPLKALSNDIERNLQFPLQGIKTELQQARLPDVQIEVMVRTGDTPMADRANMLKHPPHILVTTPESLYLLLTSVNGRKMLSTVHTLIIDEIHALVGDKRGSHLSLSVERLEALVKRKLHRIGLSATQKPVEQVAKFLVGNSLDEKLNCKIVDTGHSRKLDLSIEIPRSPLTSVMANEVWSEIYDKLIELIQLHETTLIFVNTRRLAERLSHNLNERLGAGQVLAHHGSMSKDHRFEAEQKLKSGNLKTLVATASMELGIDVGSIDLVCQIGSPHSIAAFLQRVGRSGHSVDKTPKGKLFPLTCDELVECVAIMDAIQRGELDKIIMPEKPLDILAQQIIAETACEEYTEEELFALVKRAYPYRDLIQKEFDEVITMLAEGFSTRMGRRAAYIYHDSINHRIKARKGARLTAIMSGGAIPDNFEYDVMLEPENVFLGTLNEDFAIESIPGDIFQLGNNSWRILRIENGKVRVADAEGQPPNIPFWLGEAPGRTAELSLAVSRLREEIAGRLDLDSLAVDQDGISYDNSWKEEAVNWLVEEKKIAPEAADQMVVYLAASKAALKVMPSQHTLVMERFFDEAGDMHLVIHSPFGSRLNKAWGLALRKRFCRTFNFELQAAANDDAIILSLGSTHSFPLEEVFNYLNPASVREVLVQAMLDAPVFGIRWRWNASRALAVVRRRADRKVPAQLQRMQSEDLVAHVFPDQLACLENIQGNREVPDHPLVNQTIRDCLYEAMDIEGLESLLVKIKNKEVELVAMDLKEPSPLAHEILNARPYAFLDDAPLEERRTQAVKSRRWFSPADLTNIGQLDAEAIATVKREAWPEVTNADELHDALLLSGFITGQEVTENTWSSYIDELLQTNRATALELADQHLLWVATERLSFIQEIYPKHEPLYKVVVPEWLMNIDPDKDALTELVRGRLEIMGPVTARQIANLMTLPVGEINAALYRLENEGFIFRGKFNDTSEEEWCERRLLARIHRYNIQKLRSEIKPVSAADFMRFLFAWHQMVADGQGQGPDALEHIIQKLEGFEAPAASWEGEIFPSRIADYDYLWLDMLCISGKIAWGRFRPSVSAINKEKKAASPIKTTPITFLRRNYLSTWKNVSSGIEETKFDSDSLHLSANALLVLTTLEQCGASFFDDILQKTKLFPSQTEDALGELISACLITSDSFTGMRALLVPNKFKTQAGSKRNSGVFSMNYAGRWSLLYAADNVQTNAYENTEAIAWALLRRYGCIFRKLAEHENLTPPWRDLVKVLRTMEARGQIRGGRFVEGVWGEQFALPEAIVELRNSRKANSEHQIELLISISAADPLNLTGILTPGRRIASYSGNRILYRNGIPVAIMEAKEVQFLIEVDEDQKWALKNALVQRTISPKLRKYLGKGVY